MCAWRGGHKAGWGEAAASQVNDPVIGGFWVAVSSSGKDRLCVPAKGLQRHRCRAETRGAGGSGGVCEFNTVIVEHNLTSRKPFPDLLLLAS